MNKTESANGRIDPRSRCDVCGHWYSDHDICTERCDSCDRFAQPHTFQPRRLAGGAYTPEDERAAYERALRGL